MTMVMTRFEKSSFQQEVDQWSTMVDQDKVYILSGGANSMST